jgi:4-pyridoxate dehydrogenase
VLRPAYVDEYGIRPTILHPESRGEVLLRSRDPREPVRIVRRYRREQYRPLCAKARS